jgi:hypothetical protein
MVDRPDGEVHRLVANRIMRSGLILPPKDALMPVLTASLTTNLGGEDLLCVKYCSQAALCACVADIVW